MYFSYYFDVKKTHVLNCGFVTETLGVQGDGTITNKFTSYIEEIKNGVRLKREQRTQEFTFPAAQRVDDPNDYDLDFLRERYAPHKKWIFIIKNNRNPLQSIRLGLISETANQNPLGMDIFYEDEKFISELKASNLARLESNYEAPIIQQTLVNFDFNTPGFPDGFSLSSDATYDSSYKFYEASRFNLALTEAIQEHTKFRISMDIAPNAIEVETPPQVFNFILNGVGTFSLRQSSISYLQDGDDESNRVSRNFLPAELPLSPLFFFNYGLRDKAKLTIEGDGQGTVKITYGGHTIAGQYDASKRVTGLSHESAEGKNAERIKVKLDNISVIYEK